MKVFSRGNNENEAMLTKWESIGHLKSVYLDGNKVDHTYQFKTRDGGRAVFGACHDYIINDDNEEVLENTNMIWWGQMCFKGGRR